MKIIVEVPEDITNEELEEVIRRLQEEYPDSNLIRISKANEESLSSPETRRPSEYTWDQNRPQNGQNILVYFPGIDYWHEGFYWDDGIDGLVEFPGNDLAEIEEYGKHTMTKWKEVTS